jgi:CMP-2-keto-3-deoxyoctulosonic acid synthetase
MVVVVFLAFSSSDFLTSVLCIVVAMDDGNISECCRGLGDDVIMTSVSCHNGKASAFCIEVSFHDCLVASLVIFWMCYKL